MSFYSNFQSDKCPGSLSGNPLNGLTEKVCIQAEKIFDAGIKQTQIENYSLVLTDLDPATVTYPLTFISARSVTAEGTVTNLNIERQADKHCARVQATVSIPVQVLYTDATGVEGSATATVTMTEDWLLYGNRYGSLHSCATFVGLPFDIEIGNRTLRRNGTGADKR